MRATAETLYPIIVLAVLAGATLWLERTTREEMTTSTAPPIGDPDFIAEGARLVSFDETGAQAYKLVASLVTHYPRMDLSLLENPRLEMQQDARRARIEAHSGEVRSRGDEVLLKGSVNVWREGIEGEADLTLVGETLTVWPRDQRAASDDPVTITQGSNLARGNALRADNLFGTFELQGRASVQMQPRSRTPQ